LFLAKAFLILINALKNALIKIRHKKRNGKYNRRYINPTASSQTWENNVTINILSPGPVGHIDQFDNAIELNEKSNIWTIRKNNSQQDIAESVLFLCSEEASHIMGSEINFKWK